MKKVKVALYALGALAVLGLMVYFFSMDHSAYKASIHAEVTVVDGVPNIEGFEREFEIERTGKYRISAEWKTEQDGMITAIEILNEEGVRVNTFAASWMTMQSGPMQMEKGTYILKATFLTSAEAEKEFYTDKKYLFEEWDVPYVWSDSYEFASNGFFVTDYNFNLKRDFPILGMAVLLGMALGFFLVAIILTVATKGNDKQAVYDERQEAVRGKGFNYAFVGVLFYNLFVYLLDMMQVDLHMSLSTSAAACATLGVTIYAVYCIWNDGYFALNLRKAVVLITIIIGGLFNIGMAVYATVTGKFWVDGQFSFYAISLFCGIMCFVILMVLLVKWMKDRKEA